MWFSSRSKCGKNYSSTLVKEAYKKAGLHSQYSVRSIRATAIQKMADAGFDNETIKQRTGHASDQAISQYKRPNEVQRQKEVSLVLSANRTTTSTLSPLHSRLRPHLPADPTSTGLYPVLILIGIVCGIVCGMGLALCGIGFSRI